MTEAIQAIASASINAAGLNGMQSQMSQIQNQIPAQLSSLSAAGDRSDPMPFSDLLTDAVGEVNKLQNQAGRAVRGLITGTGVDVHQAMIAGQKASMAFELSLAVRNKAMQAYQQVMSMQF